MAGDAQRMNDLLALSHVQRWSVVRTTHPQSVADHSFRVAVIALELYYRLPQGSKVSGAMTLNLGEILMWALTHDAGESHTGDIPGHIKYGNPELTTAIHHVEQQRCGWMREMVEPSPYTKCLVKIADLIECVTFIWMHKHGSHANWVWRYLDGRLQQTVKGCCETLGCTHDQIDHVVYGMVTDIQTDEGRLKA